MLQLLRQNKLVGVLFSDDPEVIGNLEIIASKQGTYETLAQLNAALAPALQLYDSHKKLESLSRHPATRATIGHIMTIATTHNAASAAHVS